MITFCTKINILPERNKCYGLQENKSNNACNTVKGNICSYKYLLIKLILWISKI